MTERFTGLCERWNNEKGYGFIRLDDDSGPSIFVHASQIRADYNHRHLAVGQACEFEIGRDAQGRPLCVNLVVIEPVDPEAGTGA